MRFFGLRTTSGGAAASEEGEGRDAAGRRRAFDSTVLPHLDAAYSYACYLSRDQAAAEDIVQDALLRAFRGFDAFRGEAGRAWLFAIVRNCFFNSLGDRRAATSEELQAYGDDAGLVDRQTPESIVTAQQEAARLRDVIAALPQPFREVLVLRELEELSYREIALVTDAPIGTVMSRLARARQMLADVLLGDTAAGEGAVP